MSSHPARVEPDSFRTDWRAALLRRSRLAWQTRRRLLIALVAVIAGLAAAPMLVLPGVIVPHAEKLASTALKEPVRIGSARLFLLPWPHVTLRDIAVGKRPFLEVGRLSVTPRIASLFGDQLRLSKVDLTTVTVHQPLFTRLGRWTSAGDGAPLVQVERIQVSDADLKLTQVDLAGIDADVRLSPGNKVSSLLARIDGGRLSLSLTPEGTGYAVQVAARSWVVPATALALASLEGRGKLTGEGLDLPTVEGAFHGGGLTGRLGLSWKPDWKLAGQFRVENVDLKPVAAAYSSKTPISGRLNAAVDIDMRAPTAAALAAAPNIAADFEVKDGVLHGIDIVSAARLLPGREDAKAGDTRFDRFTGHLLVDAEGFHFTKLRISSGVLNAEGFVSILPRQQLSGRMEAAVKGTGSLVGTPLALSGTLESPRVLPTKGTVAGAAAGTLLLGPGVGTTIGMKAAQFTERLFGKKPPRPKEPASQPAGSTASQTQPVAKPKPDAEAPPGRR
jgi:hypothetical protein